MMRLLLICALLCLTSTESLARNHHATRHHHHRVHTAVHHSGHRAAHRAVAVGSIITVPTAAGIPITVAAHLAERFQGFIAELVSTTGYTPRHIGSFARSGHVQHSRHYAGAALDIDQHGWNKTALVMYSPVVTALARKHGLRSGCEFRRRDCGHIDDGGCEIQTRDNAWHSCKSLGRGFARARTRHRPHRRA